MSLTYLSGDEIGRNKVRKGNSGTKGKGGNSKKMTPAEKKQARKRVTKKVAKVAVAPARVAFLNLVQLNVAKLATQLARAWNKPGGKDKVLKFWANLNGNERQLKAAIIKGSKVQISGDGANSGGGKGVDMNALLAAATPILTIVSSLLKNLGAHGSEKEAKDLDQAITEGKKALVADPETPKTTVNMPLNKEVGLVADKEGKPVSDSKTEAKNEPENKTGGNDNNPAVPSEQQKKEAEKTLSSFNYSPAGFYFMILMYGMLCNNYLSQYKVFSFIYLFSVISIVLIPVALMDSQHILVRIARFIAFTPIEKVNQLLKKISHG